MVSTKVIVAFIAKMYIAAVAKKMRIRTLLEIKQ